MEESKSVFIKKKSLGQNFLTSPVVPGWMCDAADIKAGEIVLEIGPGSGVLTRELLARDAKVVALEADKRAVELLQHTFSSEVAAGSLIIHHTDVRALDITKYSFIKNDFKVVSNIPYYLTGWLFRTLLENDLQPSLIVFLIQKEVAWRIARDPKESLLSLAVKVFGEVTYVREVSRGHFSPPPKVDSAILKVSNINRTHFTKSVEPAFFFTVLHLGFGQKRKQLLGNLAKQYDRSVLNKIFDTLKISPTARAEDIPLNSWLQLVTELKKQSNTNETI